VNETPQQIEERLMLDHYAEGMLIYDFVNCPTRVDRNGPYFPQDVIAALIHCHFVLIEASRLLGRRRQALKDYIYRNPDMLDWWVDHQEGVLDHSEAVVIRSMMAGESADARYLLNTLGKERGYTTKSEVTNVHKFENMTDEELDAILARNAAYAKT
jgi:hypothetical protein